MTNDEPDLQPRGVVGVLRLGIGLYSKNLRPLWGLLIPLAFVSESVKAIALVAATPRQDVIRDGVIYAPSTMLGSLRHDLTVQVGITVVCWFLCATVSLCVLRETVVGRSEGDRGPVGVLVRRLPALLGATAAVSILVALGLLVLVPGLYIGTGLAVALPVLVIEGRRPLDALERSWSLERGRRLATGATMFAGGLFVFGGIYLLERANRISGSLSLFASVRWLTGVTIDLVLIPVVSVLTVAVYLDLRARKEPDLLRRAISAGALHADVGANVSREPRALRDYLPADPRLRRRLGWLSAVAAVLALTELLRLLTIGVDSPAYRIGEYTGAATLLVAVCGLLIAVLVRDHRAVWRPLIVSLLVLIGGGALAAALDNAGLSTTGQPDAAAARIIPSTTADPTIGRWVVHGTLEEAYAYYGVSPLPTARRPNASWLIHRQCASAGPCSYAIAIRVGNTGTLTAPLVDIKEAWTATFPPHRAACGIRAGHPIYGQVATDLVIWFHNDSRTADAREDQNAGQPCGYSQDDVRWTAVRR